MLGEFVRREARDDIRLLQIGRVFILNGLNQMIQKVNAPCCVQGGDKRLTNERNVLADTKLFLSGVRQS